MLYKDLLNTEEILKYVMFILWPVFGIYLLRSTKGGKDGYSKGKQGNT